MVAGGDYGEKVQYKLFKFAEVNGEVSAQLVLEKVEKVIEGSGKNVGIREEKETTIPMDVNPKRLQSDEERSLQ